MVTWRRRTNLARQLIEGAVQNLWNKSEGNATSYYSDFNVPLVPLRS